ncbi:protein BIG GRAIN 1-like [Dendrobium catenatum]|uniref:Protein BIG GRAIN 1-like A n=1 Tax=Dendrobium catenatum TaxID=906689 RepID=A0A2I0WDR4_9ASPA|nr:protein BIG GRAIN 1-like [Dendrobium catenatum]PKU73807.1 hypothetical protein MA16_Dca011953 [Dendrobium catenatum]
MEKWEQSRPQAPPSHRHGRNNPSFSSSLLDAIYRSIDDSDAVTPCLVTSSIDKNCAFRPPPPATLRRAIDPVDDRRHRRFCSATSSSDTSRFGGFSSSDFDSATRPRPVLTRSKLIRMDPPPPPETKRTNRSIRSRIRDLQKSPASASPGSRLTAFVNAIFAGGSDRTPNKPKCTGRMENPASATSSSYFSKSGTSNAAPFYNGRGKQESVRISPVNDFGGGDLRQTRPCGGGDSAAASDRRMMVELFRGFEKIEDQEDCESVSSSDLFELESLSVIGRFTDELPVYESTNLGNSRAIPRRFIA